MGKKNIKTPDNFGYGDMPADFRMRYKQMLEEHNDCLLYTSDAADD